MLYGNIERWQSLLAAARGEKPADLRLDNAIIINVFSGEATKGSVAISEGRIAGIGEYEAVQVIDLKGAVLAPGFIEGHIHIESSKLIPPCFAEAVVPHGTTCVVADPHEIANVWGIEGIRYMLRCSHDLPLDIYYMLPSCVPATSMETAGASLSAADLHPLLDEPTVLGIAELMNFPGALFGDPEVLSKSALANGKRPIDGHAPGLTGKKLAAYLAAGPATDHECNTIEEAREKLSLGMRIMIREGSTARNLSALLPLVTPTNERRFMLVSDDRRPSDLVEQGHLDHSLRRAVAEGLDPITAIRMVTINTAEAFGLGERGGIRPGWRADLVALDNLKSLRPLKVWKDGRLVAESGKMTIVSMPVTRQAPRPLSVPPLSEESFAAPDKHTPIRVIGVVPDQIVTESLEYTLCGHAGRLTSDPSLDIAKLAVIERHTGSGRVAVAFIKGLGLKEGALASTVAHDSHNIIVAGMDDRSMLSAAKSLIRMGGGQVAALGDKLIAEFPLPIAGLMTDQDVATVAANEEELGRAAHSLGCKLSDPFMALSFLALPVIPHLKLTDHGLVDVDLFKHVPLYVQ